MHNREQHNREQNVISSSVKEFPKKESIAKKETKVAELYKDKKKETNEEKKFRATPIISPIYGVLDKNYTPQSLMMIGYNDARDSHIIFNDLPETIRNCPEYLEGYRRGLEEEQTKSKHR